MTSYSKSRKINRRKDPRTRNIKILSSNVTAMTFQEQMSVINLWITERASKCVCVANVHMIMEAHKDQEFNAILDNADLVTADGMPLVLLMRLLGARFQNRVAGMDIFLKLCSLANEHGVGVFFLGTNELTLALIRERLSVEFPDMPIAGMLPLPFRPLTEDEDKAIISQINNSGAGLVFLALGCPKQERWIYAHHNKIKSTVIGVGAVFPVYAGLQKHAPAWIRNASLEWLYRLVQEPRRLWYRYFSTIPPFLFYASRQIFAKKIVDLLVPPSKNLEHRSDSEKSFTTLDLRNYKVLNDGQSK